MNDIPLKQIIDASLSQIGKVADVNTVIGEPISTGDGITIVPFSKVSVGYASGGTDFDGKNPSPDKAPHFTGGNGAGVSVTPLGFLIIENGNVRLLDLKNPVYPVADDPVTKVMDSVNSFIDRTPDLVEKIKGIFSKDKKKADSEAITGETAENLAEAADAADSTEA